MRYVTACTFFAVIGLLAVTNAFAQAPSNPLEVALLRWYPVNQATQITSCGTAYNPTSYGAAFDGQHIWVGCYNANRIVELNVSDGSVVRTITTVTAPIALAYDGANIWVSTPSSAVKVQASTGTVLGTYSLGVGPLGLAFDGQNIWAAANSGGGFATKILATTGAHTNFPLTGCSEAVSVAFDGTNVWIGCYNGEVFELNTSGSILFSTYVSYPAYGLAFDGTNIWVATSNPGSCNCLVSINVQSKVVQFFNPGAPAGLGGLADIAFDGTYVWVVGGSFISKVLASTGAVVASYSGDGLGWDAGWGGNPIAFDGANIWATNSEQGTVYKF